MASVALLHTVLFWVAYTAGCTYCAVAALRMLGRLADLPSKDLLLLVCLTCECPAFDSGMSFFGLGLY